MEKNGAEAAVCLLVFPHAGYSQSCSIPASPGAAEQNSTTWPRKGAEGLRQGGGVVAGGRWEKNERERAWAGKVAGF